MTIGIAIKMSKRRPRRNAVTVCNSLFGASGRCSSRAIPCSGAPGNFCKPLNALDQSAPASARGAEIFKKSLLFCLLPGI
jgi:hypothetical protein